MIHFRDTHGVQRVPTLVAGDFGAPYFTQTRANAVVINARFPAERRTLARFPNANNKVVCDIICARARGADAFSMLAGDIYQEHCSLIYDIEFL